LKSEMCIYFKTEEVIAWLIPTNSNIGGIDNCTYRINKAEDLTS